MKKFIITAGGTSEKIDNVRKITNSSSVKLGCIIANTILEEISDARIYYICSKNSIRPKNDKVKVIEVDGVLDLKSKVEFLLRNDNIDFFVHSMAVSDYMIDYVTTLEKMEKSFTSDDDFSNVDIIIVNKNKSRL